MMTRKRILTTGAIAMLLPTCLVLTVVAIHAARSEGYPRTKGQWIEQQVQRLRRLQIADVSIANASRFFGGVDMDFCLAPREGLIAIPDGAWFYVVSHSFHDNEQSPKRKRTTIGDITIAMDRNGRFYVNYGHVCGNLQLHAKSTVRNARDFLATRGGSEDGPPWQPLTPP